MPREFSIRQEIDLHATPDEVWNAIATGPGLATWFFPMPITPDSPLVTTWEPGRHLVTQAPPAGDGSTQAFEYFIEARQGGTALLRFVHSGFLGDDWSEEFESMTGQGWAMYLYTLSRYLIHFSGRSAVYIGAEGPPPSAQPDRWSRVAAALHPTDPLVLKAAVRVDLPGVGALEGVVDYLTANFVGIRTADALIRFHGRAPLGMTVAVSHHAYDAAEADATSKAWGAWLANVFR